MAYDGLQRAAGAHGKSGHLKKHAPSLALARSPWETLETVDVLKRELPAVLRRATREESLDLSDSLKSLESDELEVYDSSDESSLDASTRVSREGRRSPSCDLALPDDALRERAGVEAGLRLRNT